MTNEKCPHIEEGICVECKEVVAPFRSKVLAQAELINAYEALEKCVGIWSGCPKYIRDTLELIAEIKKARL